jgi:hypothetical protein
VSADDPRLDAAFDELYGVEPEVFVETRKRLAATLRADGAADVAKEVAAARRPTVAAWALNQLRRREPGRLSEFLARSRDLRGATRDRLRDALAAQRTAFNELTDAALALLGDRANDTYRAQITGTLHAATADESVAAVLERGRLTREIDEVGFPSGVIGAATGRAPSSSAPSRRRAKPKLTVVPDPEPEPEPEPEPKPDPEEQRRAEQRARADAELRAAEQEAEAARRVHDEAQREFERRSAELDVARRAVRAAADRARQARRDVERLTKARARLE